MFVNLFFFSHKSIKQTNTHYDVTQGGGALEQEPDAGAEPGHSFRSNPSEQPAPHGGHLNHGHRHDVPEPDH